MGNCFAHSHMTCRQYGLYTRIRELQSKFGFVYFDADDLSAGFVSTSRDVIYDDCTFLLNSGWFELRAARKRKKDGTWEARRITAITHKEWVAKNPDKCLNPQESHSANSDAPVGKQRLTNRQIATDHSADSDAPVAPRRQRLGSTPDMIQIRQDSTSDTVQTRAEKNLSFSTGTTPKSEEMQKPVTLSIRLCSFEGCTNERESWGERCYLEEHSLEPLPEPMKPNRKRYEIGQVIPMDNYDPLAVPDCDCYRKYDPATGFGVCDIKLNREGTQGTIQPTCPDMKCIAEHQKMLDGQKKYDESVCRDAVLV